MVSLFGRDGETSSAASQISTNFTSAKIEVSSLVYLLFYVTVVYTGNLLENWDLILNMLCNKQLSTYRLI